MIMRPDVLGAALKANYHGGKLIYMSPRGRQLTQDYVKELSTAEDLTIICGRFEGIDQRIIDLDIDEEISIGDYVLTSGDLASMVLINAVLRYVKGVLGSEESTDEESFADGLLEYPHYTRPYEFEGLCVPDILIGGDHSAVAEWRKEQSILLTKKLRPDLIDRRNS